MRSTNPFSYRALSGYLGFSVMCIGVILLLPLAAILGYPDEIRQTPYFIVPGVLSLLAGYLLFLAGHVEHDRIGRQQDAVLVLCFWVLAVVLSSLPFFMTGKYTFIQSLFEATSGWSTTGLSVVDVESAPRIFLLYRSVLLYFGGLGIVLVMSTILSSSSGMQLFNAEGHSDRLLPGLLESARMVVLIYSGYIFAGIILYRVFGMGWFDAINHSIAAVSTGGFSTRADSIGYYNSLPIEVITVVLMILGNIGFAAHVLILKRRIREFFFNEEFRFFCLLLAVFIPILVVLLAQSVAGSMPENARIAVFQVVSALTTTGFQTVSGFSEWNDALVLVLTVLMLIGGGIGSTAGGIKQYRIFAFLRGIQWSIRDSLLSNKLIFHDKITRAGFIEIFDYKAKSGVASFVGTYLLIYGLGVFTLTLFKVDLPDALFEFASAMGTVGLSRNVMTAAASPGILVVGIIGMFLGRLEIFVVIMAIHKMSSDVLAFFKGKKNTG